jgi:dTDP-4-amino-4,6-dideoxygalactose transaminase
MRYCFLLSSGKAALAIILRALKDIQPERDEVLIPAFTCYSVPSAIVRTGLKIKLCDISPDTLDLDFKQLSGILSTHSAPQPVNKPDKHKEPDQPNEPNEPNKPISRLLCIIPTHLFGIPSHIGKIRKLLHDPHVTIVEDAAQAMGAEWKGKKLGTFGDISFFSLGRGKAFSAVEGGIILTDRSDIADKVSARMESLRDYCPVELTSLFCKAISLCLFVHPSLYWFPRLMPFLKLGETIYDPHFKMKNMSAFQAGLARDWQRKLRGFKQIRAENSMAWASVVRTNELTKYVTKNGSHPGVIRFPVKIDGGLLRARILRRSNTMGLGIMPTYPDSIDRIPEMGDYFESQSFPLAKQVADHLITFPTHPFVTRSDRVKIAELISEIPQEGRLSFSD